MSVRWKSVCVDGALTLAENLQSNEENEKSLYLLAAFLPLVVFLFYFFYHVSIALVLIGFFS